MAESDSSPGASYSEKLEPALLPGTAPPESETDYEETQRRDVETDHEETQHRDAEESSEGGKQAWLAVAGSFLVYFASFGVVNSFGYFQNFYQEEYLKDSSPSTISFIGTLQITLMYLSGAPAGALFDLFGTKWLYLFAAVGGSVSMLATSFTKPNAVWQLFLAQSIPFGLTVAFGVQPALTVVGQHFKKRRALAMGIVASGSSLGGVCLPVMFSKLVPKIGFPWSMRAGMLILIVCYAAAIVISPPGSPKKKVRSIKDLLDYRGFLDIRYACLAAGAVASNLGTYVPFYYLEPFCATIEPNSKIQSYLLPLINASSLLGRIIGGHLADRVGRLNFLYPMVLFCGFICLAMWYTATSPGVLVGFACLYGFGSGGLISVMPAATAQIIPAEKLGARLGAFGTFTAFAFLAGTPIAGALIKSETRSGYQPVIIFAGSCLLGGGVIIFIARLLHDRNLRSKW
ncbi:MFS general substrate transporter [Trichoderma chlorosporum]